jgi:hypothetical protein
MMMVVVVVVVLMRMRMMRMSFPNPCLSSSISYGIWSYSMSHLLLNY